MKVRVHDTPDLAGLVRSLVEASCPAPFSAELIDLCDRVSQGLMAHPASRRFPELVALAFWLRRAEVTRLARDHRALETDRALLAPRGLVFHVPPSNVDTISVYSWALSLLVGNKNVVRVSDRPSELTDTIVEVLGRALSEAPEPVRRGNAVVAYGHDDAVTEALSAKCDVRVLWGGDATVQTLRRIPLPPHAVELTFPDRWSFALIDGAAFNALEDRRPLAEQFFNDAYWFDQLGCASPRLVVWLGERGEGLFDEVAAVARERGWKAATGTALDKIHAACRAVLDRDVRALRLDNTATAILLDALPSSREHGGGGLFYEVVLDSLDPLVDYVQRKDQTVTYFGVSADTLRDLARRLAGRGVDRFVPVGQALAFHRYWDGHDLLQALSRRVWVG